MPKKMDLIRTRTKREREQAERRTLREMSVNYAVQLKTSTRSTFNLPTLVIANRIYRFILTGKVSALGK